MKKLSFLFPILIFLLFMTLGNKIFTTGKVSPSTLVIIVVVAMVMITMMKPKGSAAKATSNIEQKARGEFA